MCRLDVNDDERHCLISDADGSLSDMWAFRYSKLVTVRKWICYILTVFFLRLVFQWFPQWHIRFIMSSCKIKDADMFLIKDSSGVFYTVDVRRALRSVLEVNDSGSTYSSALSDTSQFFTAETSQNNIDGPTQSWIYYKNLKYVLNNEDEHYYLLPNWDERPSSDIVNAQPLVESEVACRRSVYDVNDIPIPRRSVGQLLLKEGLNQFYVFQLASCILWFCDSYYYYAAAILIISAMSLSWNICDLRRNEKALRETVTSYGTVNLCREVNGHQKFFSVNSTDLVPGDIIEIPRDGCHMFCDAVLLQGNCIVNESTLTGESVPVTKIPFVASWGAGCASPPFELKASSKSVLFCGTSVIQSRNFADQKVTAVVVRTGFRTAKGEMVRAILFPKPMKFKFTRDVNRFVGVLALISLGGFAFSVYILLRNGTEPGVVVKRAFDLITVAVPPALPVAMTVGIAFAQGRLKKKNIFCINPSVINVCGIIDVACFDKTGTITEDGLDLWGVISNGDGTFEKPVAQPSELPQGPLLETMATCHSLTRIGGELSGDPLDLKMFLSTNWEFTEEISEDYCKFEMTIPAIVRPRVSPSTEVSSANLAEVETLPYEIGIVRQFPFSSTLQRMSVIARALNGSHFCVYTKGSPEMIETLCRKETLPRDFHKVLLEYTREGYRVLALAWRPLRVAYTRVMRLQRTSIERQLQFLGLLVMENRLKPESAPVIKLLKEARIRPVMVTGDNMLTALSVARDCEMIDEMDRIIIVSAKSPKRPSKSAMLEEVSGDSHISGGGSSTPDDSVELWKNLVQFHYAEDLHKPVTEVTTASKRQTSDLESEEELNVIRRLSTIARWLPCLRRKRILSSSSGGVENDVEAYGAASSGEKGNERAQQMHADRLPGRAKLGHRITLRMVDRPDFHLALSGKTWAIIREHFPSLIPKLVVKGTVFARFSPEQKSQLVEALQCVGYSVSMCGDGANDCGALKAAHAGIALSQAEASVASPFTSGLQNISCVPRLIREGRCALATSFGTFKFMMGYSITQFTSVLILYVVNAALEDMQFLYIDLFVITSLGVTFSYAKAYGRLSPEPPTMRLVSTTTLLSLGSQLLLIIGTQLATFFYIGSQPWAFEEGEMTNTAIFLISCYQYILLAVVFSKGPPYRQRIYTNYLFLANVLIVLGTNLLINLYQGEALLNFMTLVVFPSYTVRVMLILIALANFLLGSLIEMLVEGVAFRRHMRELKKTLFPRYVARKDYERIREEIDRMAGDWPPVIRSASIQDIRTEFFAEEQQQEAAHCFSGDRVRDDSCSFCSEDDNHDPVRVRDSGGAAFVASGRRRRHSSSHFHNRSRSLEASELRSLMKNREHDGAHQMPGDSASEQPSGMPATTEGAGSKGTRQNYFYVSRHRTQSSTCDQRKGPADADKIPVLPLHDPGLS
ncbi:putative cation-transporting ATPase W08D2.5 [Echinococcus granulosus]|nr:putative cation-transporting ATPase W08D2.5 [Echinococcus granulosus]